MTDYTFTGAFPRVLTGLSQGVNAILTPAAGDSPPDGSTLEARPGDTIQTDEPYEHPELAVVESGGDDESDDETSPKPKPRKPATADTTDN